MSRADDTTADAVHQISHAARMLYGMLRKMKIGVTSKPLWQAIGIRLLDGVTVETRPTEHFTGIGFFSRPRRGSKADGIMASIGDAENPAFIATRDEALRQEMVPDIDNDETATFNGLSLCIHKKTGVTEIRSKNGTALRLPTMADFNALRAVVDGHKHLYAPGPGSPILTSGPDTPTPAPTGTQVLMAE